MIPLAQPPITVEATAYSPCSSGSINASGTHTRFGQVAVPAPGLFGWLPMGTRILLRHPRSLRGRRHFYVRDRIGAWSQLDIFLPNCGEAIRFGRRTVRFTVVGR